MCIIRKPAPFRHFFYRRPLSYARNQRSMDNFFFIENSTFTSDSKPIRACVESREEENMRRTIQLLMMFGIFGTYRSWSWKSRTPSRRAWGRNLKSSVISQVAGCHSARCGSHPRRRVGNCWALEKAERDENEDHEPEHEKIRSFDTNLAIKTNNRAVRQMPRRQFPSRLHNHSGLMQTIYRNYVSSSTMTFSSKKKRFGRSRNKLWED